MKLSYLNVKEKLSKISTVDILHIQSYDQARESLTIIIIIASFLYTFFSVSHIFFYEK